MAADAMGDVYVGGELRGLNVRMGPYMLHNQLQQSRYYVPVDGGLPQWRGDHDAFLMKLSDSGTVLWAREYGGLGRETLNGIVRTPSRGYPTQRVLLS